MEIKDSGSTREFETGAHRFMNLVILLLANFFMFPYMNLQWGWGRKSYQRSLNQRQHTYNLVPWLKERICSLICYGFNLICSYLISNRRYNDNSNDESSKNIHRSSSGIYDNPNMTGLLTIIFIIVIHEFGHFIAGKLLHVPVYEFAVGMLMTWLLMQSACSHQPQ